MSKKSLFTLSADSVAGCFVSLLLFVFMSGCGVTSAHADTDKFKAEEYFHSPWLGISFYQDGEKVDMVSIDPLKRKYDRIKVKLEAEPFEIRIPVRTENDRVRICVWTDDSIFTEAAIKNRVESDTVFSSSAAVDGPVFSPPELYVSNTQHNSYYNERLEKISLFQNRISVSMISFPHDNSRRYHLSKQKGPLYMVVFMDLDMDGLLEREELEYFVLDF